jgi:putative polyhydroxyalkanoate system protein
MSLIDIHARHNMSTEDAQWAADDLARDLAEQFGIDYGWDEEIIHFERPGVHGTITFGENDIHIKAKLGFMLLMLKNRIEEEVVSYLSKHFGCTFDD